MKESLIEIAKVPSAFDNAEVFSSATQHDGEAYKVKEDAEIKVESATPDMPNDALISKGNADAFAAKKMANSDTLSEFERDLQSMTKMELRSKYFGEASSHRNMLGRRKSKGAKVHDEFTQFRDFLKAMGTKPTKSATLDRINNTDPEYAPGKVRWADKKTQNNNKGDSLVFTCLATGTSFTASQLAKKQSVTPACIRRRRTKGWTDAEIIAGSRKAPNSLQPSSKKDVAYIPQQPAKSAKEINFERCRDACQHYREENGCEKFIATPAEMQEIFSDDFPAYRGHEWLESAEARFMRSKFPRWLSNFKPHLIPHKLTPDQQERIRQIDPNYAPENKLFKSL